MALFLLRNKSNLQNLILSRLFLYFVPREGHGWPSAGEHQDSSEPTNDMSVKSL
jgi:exo-beta-1,3-glucanase (GH17 family)